MPTALRAGLSTRPAPAAATAAANNKDARTSFRWRIAGGHCGLRTAVELLCRLVCTSADEGRSGGARRRRAGIRPGMDWLELGFVHQPQRGFEESAQGCLRRLESGEFDEVAVLQEFGQALLLVERQQTRRLQFHQEFIGGAFRGAEVEPFFQVNAESAGNFDAKQPRVAEER